MNLESQRQTHSGTRTQIGGGGGGRAENYPFLVAKKELNRHYSTYVTFFQVFFLL